MDEVKQLMEMLGKLGGHWGFDEATQQMDMLGKLGGHWEWMKLSSSWTC